MPANVALAALVTVRLLISIRPSASTPVAAIAPPVPAFRPKFNVPTPSVMMPPKLMPAPAAANCVVATLELSVSVTPPVPKFTNAPLVTVAAKLDAALPVKTKPPVNANVSAVRLPKVTAPVLLKSMFATNVLVAPVMVTVYGLAVVIKSFT